MTSAPEWQAFSVGVPSDDPTQPNKDCRPFKLIHHVTHLDAAHAIFAQGKLRAGLVSDESKLNKHRILVNWLSPNTWSNGSRYGNIQFTFKWPEIIRGLNFYWVEAIAYTVPAPRILATAQNHDKLLQPYEPDVRDGPWWHSRKDDTHYRNGDYTLEIMIERDVDLSECVEVEFIRHHPGMCCLDSRRCRERGMYDFKAATKFLGGHLSGYGFSSAETAEWAGPPINLRQLKDAWDSMERILSRHMKNLSFGDIKADVPIAPVLARSLFRVFATAPQKDVDKEALRTLAALFADQGAVLDACRAEFTRVFGELGERPL